LVRPGSAARGSRCTSAVLAFLFLLWAVAWAAPPSTPQLDGSAIIDHLNAAISWYRHLASLDVTAGQPSDVLYLENARSTAAQALQLAFQSALAEAAPLQAKKTATETSTADQSHSQPDDQQQNIAKAVADIADRIAQTQAQVDAVNKQIAEASPKKRQQFISQRDALQGELDLDKMIQEALQKVSSVSNGNGGSTGLARQIQQLKQSVPEVFAANQVKKVASTGQSSTSNRAQNSGLLGQTAILFGQVRDIHDIDQLMDDTVRLRNRAEKLDAPLRDSLRDLIQQGRSLVNAPPTSDPAQVAAMRRQFESLTAQFKQISDAAVPLRQEIILLDQCHGELLEWRNSISVEYRRVLRSLLLRVAGILLALGFVFLLSALWRRATYRYVHEPRRRRQLLLIRRFVTGFLIVLVIAAGFISEFSSLATFAGFLTAGIAVALQTVILSMAAYFSLVGRYGLRIGDRVTVGGVTGDVVDVGLVRLYLLELAGTGIYLYPTGRIVVFSNSVMFQAAPFFKQIPGTSYAWHEVAVTLSPEGDHGLLEQKLVEAVNEIFAKHRAFLERQHPAVDTILDAQIATPVPKAGLQFSDAGIEFVVRYPVDISRAAEIDEEMTRKMMEVIYLNPELKKSVLGAPKLRAPIKA
jgi:small-conductance mechanosensitive channel